MKIIAIIQARSGSTRLPQKVLLELGGKTVLERVIERVKASRLIKEIVVATTNNELDQTLAEICAAKKIKVFRGSENDVLDRFYQAAKYFKADHIVRITADCPLIDPKVIDAVIKLHLDQKADYTSNTMPPSYPDGQDVEVFTAETLKTAWEQARLPSEREHVTPYMRNNSFKTANLKYKEDLSQKRWTLDNQEDFEFLETVYQGFISKKPKASLEEILAFLAEQPELEKINQHLSRNEGYAKSLKEEQHTKNRSK